MAGAERRKETAARKADADLMTEGSVWRKIIGFAVPIFLGNLFQQLYNTADSLIVGNFIGSNALAAVSEAGNLIFLVIGFFNGLSVGAGVVIANYIGARNREETGKAVHTTVALGIIFSVIMTVVGVATAAPALKLMSTPEEVLPEAVSYLRVYFAGAAGFVMYNTFVGILQAAGDSRHPLEYLIFSSLVNIFLDLLLIAGFGMGVGAAAFATVASQVLSALLSMRRLLAVDADYRLVPGKIRLDRRQTAKVIHFGIPGGLQNSVMSLSNVVIQSYINSYGAAAMAGIGAYTKVEGFAFLPVTSFALAITTFVSQNVGAGKEERTKQGIRFGCICNLISAEALGMLLYAFAGPLVAMFSKDPEVIGFGIGRSHTVTPFFFLCAFTHFMSSVLRGVGKPVESMLVFIFCWCAMRVIILAVFNPIVQNVAITYWVYPITWTLSSVTFLVLWLRTDIPKAGAM